MENEPIEEGFPMNGREETNTETRLTPTDGPPVVFSGRLVGEWSSQFEDGLVKPDEDRGKDEKRYKQYLTARLFRTAAGSWVVEIRQQDYHLERRRPPLVKVLSAAKASDLADKLRALDVGGWWLSPYPKPKEHQERRWETLQNGIRRRWDVVVGKLTQATNEEVRIA